MKRELIVEIKFVSGTVAELPKADKNLNLRPDPKNNGNPNEFRTNDEVWQAYILTAKVGDFTEFKRGKEAEPGRYETIECGKDYVVVANVEYMFGKRTEFRRKYMLPLGFKPSTSGGKKPASKEREELTIGEKKVVCDVKKDGGVTTWLSAEVPFDGVVKVDSRNYKFILTDFGRGEK
jgi:hypothetical protein